MPILLVTYDLKNEDSPQKYENVLGVIKSEKNWAKFSESCYAMDTNMTPHQVYAKIKPFLDVYDTILIFNVKAPYFGQHSKDVIEWASRKLV
ncbi:hypothetical protein [Methylophilus sp.]|uniref:hypothetical protein n=1 Tax=Methylophilus sp. TaxID=29541 RepID=UPI0040364AF4